MKPSPEQKRGIPSEEDVRRYVANVLKLTDFESLIPAAIAEVTQVVSGQPEDELLKMIAQRVSSKTVDKAKGIGPS
jgi:hypothetical protein